MSQSATLVDALVQATRDVEDAMSDVPSVRQWTKGLGVQVERVVRTHGDSDRWSAALATLPALGHGVASLDQACPSVTSPPGGILPTSGEMASIDEVFRELAPWRKGPFDVCGVTIDAEWRSDIKFSRLAEHVRFAGCRVLDVGSGNGYYALRMLGRGAAFVVGVDPSLLFATQFVALQEYFRQARAAVLPIGVADVPKECRAFDTVVSMGVLYHRRDPDEHLRELASFARAGGEVVVESLVIEGSDGDVLRPRERYAKMRNVWAVPSVATLASWMRRAGLSDARCRDVSLTTAQEQRSTAWMKGESLSDFLDPADATRTVEGYPAPRRAMFTARA